MENCNRTTCASFHECAARRGDGIHPRLLEALVKTGTAAGPTAQPEQRDNNVSQLDVGCRVKTSKPL